jgi:hypothetical protein
VVLVLQVGTYDLQHRPQILALIDAEEKVAGEEAAAQEL